MAHLLRSEGYAKQASFGLGMGGVLNIILDPLFMFVFLKPGLEVRGAALATMLSNVCALIYFFSAFAKLRGNTVLSMSPNTLRPAAAISDRSSPRAFLRRSDRCCPAWRMLSSTI